MSSTIWYAGACIRKFERVREARLKKVFALFVLIMVLQAAVPLAGQNFQVGIEVGQKIPAFRLASQDGRSLTFDAIKGPKGAALLFFRSSDW